MIRQFLTIIALLVGAITGVAADLDSIVSRLDAPGGLIVHVNPKDLKKAVARDKDGRFLIHLLVCNKDELARANALITASGLSDKVTASVFDGTHLPFIDNVVNALIVEDDPGIPPEEMLRVVTPRGRIITRQDNRTVEAAKKVPTAIDDWTHNLYNAGNTGVSRDTEVGSPRHLQWTGKPLFSRSHDGNSSFLAMVSAGGRVFYMMDEGSIAFLSLPSKWMLTARDGFNGKVLWKKPLPQQLLTQVGQMKNGFANLGHRMIAQEDVVYATLGFNQPVSALDSRTGREIWTSAATANAEELILYDGILYCVINLSPSHRITNPFQMMEQDKKPLSATVPRKLVAVDAKTGTPLWEKKPPAILPLSLTAGKYGVYIHDGSSLVCLDPKRGTERWRSEPVRYYTKLQQYSGVNVVLKGDVLLFACGTAYPHKGRDYKSPWQNTITALDARTGKILWRAPHRQDGIFTTPDLLVADGLVWHAPIDNGGQTGYYQGLDLATGNVVRDFKPAKRPQMPHHRCYRNRGAGHLLFTGWTGVNIFDVRSGTWDHNYWVRGACRYGVMPANGLLYNTPSVCTCFINSKIKGINALAASSPTRRLPKNIPENGRLVKGRAYGQSKENTKRAEALAEAWPTYRGSASRHGRASTALSDSYCAGWKTPIKGKITQPVVADSKVFIAAYDQHAVYALEEETGRIVWRYQAGSVVDSPPTIWNGRAYFGCNDGWVYCLAARTGALIWKYRAAPADRRMIACEHVESVWPVHGSILVLPAPKIGGARVYCVSGRSIFLDGGMRSLVLDAVTGRKIAETIMDERDPDTGKSVQLGHEWPPDFPAGLPDIMSYDGNAIYMGIQPFSLDGRRKRIYYQNINRGMWQKKTPDLKQRSSSGVHLFSTIGFLDDTEMHRSAWMYGRDSFGGCWAYAIPAFKSPAANIMSIGDKHVYGYGREFYSEGAKPTMHLFAMDKNPKVVSAKELFQGRKMELRHPLINAGSAAQPERVWTKKYATHMRALLLARNSTPGKPDLLFAVGVPEIIDEFDAIDLINRQQRSGFHVNKVYRKAKSIAGELGAKLMVFSAADGSLVSETKLDAPAVFDGMSGAYGKIFVSDIKGNVVCLKPAPAK